MCRSDRWSEAARGWESGKPFPPRSRSDPLPIPIADEHRRAGRVGDRSPIDCARSQLFDECRNASGPVERGAGQERGGKPLERAGEHLTLDRAKIVLRRFEQEVLEEVI